MHELTAAIIFFTIALVFAALHKPKCPRCGHNEWQEGLWPEWRCEHCNGWYDPVTKHFYD